MAQKENKGKGKEKEVKVDEVKAEVKPGFFARILDALKSLWAKIVALFVRIF